MIKSKYKNKSILYNKWVHILAVINIYNKSIVSKCRASKVFLIFSNLYSVDSSVRG